MKNQILLTGANGFLGTQIARRLIKNEENYIIALVRASNKENALRRLKRAWWNWPELLATIGKQVKLVSGDITHENLKIAGNDYKSLISSLTHIIHTVADLRLHAPLEELRLTNLQGTKNLLRLASDAQAKGNFKRFSHLSTAYVAGKRQGIILEDELVDEDNGFWSNYEQSKYEAEKAVRESNLPYSIFRPGMVVGDSQNGEIKTFNTIYILLKLYLTGKLRFIPTGSSLTLNMIPVDYVADAVNSLTFHPQALEKTFHLTPPSDSLPQIKGLIEQVQRWAVKELNITLPSPIFIPLASLIQRLTPFFPRSTSKIGLLNILFTLAPYLNEKHYFDQENVEKLLGSYPVKWEEYLPNLLKYAVHHNFFHRSERSVHEQVFFRLQSQTYPVKYYDIEKGQVKEKPIAKIRNDILRSLRSLKRLGIKAGDRVALVGQNSTRYLTLEVAIGLLGAVSVPLYYTSPPIEIKNILKDCGAKILFIGTPYLMKHLNELNDMDEMDNHPLFISFCRESPKIPDQIMSWKCFLKKGENNITISRKILAPINLNDLATIRYTSGTTGTPKGVTFNHAQLRWMAENMASLPPWEYRNRSIRYLSFLPMNHVVEGILGTYSPYYVPASLQIYFLEDFNYLASALPQVRPVIFFSVPRFYEKLWQRFKGTLLGSHYLRLKEGWIKNSLKTVIRGQFLRRAGLDRCAQLIVGSATSGQRLIQDYKDLGIEIHNAYGLTEAPLISLNRKEANHIGTVGEPLPDTHIKIAEDGEILVKGPQVTPGYFETELNSPLKDGWFKTGDLGYLTPLGSLVITGRKKELIINSYGKSIDPLKIEALLRDTEGISEVMLVGEGRPYLCGLLWVEEEYDPQRISKTIREVNRSLSHPEQIKKWVLLSPDLSIEGGDLTANMKLKRQIIMQRYQEVIDAIYHETSNPLILYQGCMEEKHGL